VAGHVRIRDVTRDRLTWQLTGFFAVQSWGFYTLVAWMPSIFESHGIGTTDAGFLLGLSGAMAIPAALLIPRLAARARDQRGLAFWLTAVLVLGYGGLLLAPAAAPALWAVMIGAAQGACFPLALTMIILRSGSPSVASSLSTHVQSIGYLLAASGPLVGGALHDATGSWTATLVVLIVILVPQALTGLGAGRARVVGAAQG
jgi:CP family cyanate transporter-like MFS transporter